MATLAGRWLVAAALVVSCGRTREPAGNGSVEEDGGGAGVDMPAEGGVGSDAGVEGDSGGVGTLPGKSGARGDGASSAAAQAAGGGGAATQPRPTPPAHPPFASGTRQCLDPRECQGYECVGALGVANTVCLAPCDEGGCEADELCADAAFLPSKYCFAACELVTDCAYAFDCFALEPDSPRLCLPTQWAVQLD
jgi:hypothetical protein